MGFDTIDENGNGEYTLLFHDGNEMIEVGQLTENVFAE